ncbi:MAG: hypothetical protein P4L84_35370 [Isosphaeraceae bacterium]|nr:hypothetical protein [Isosphaeraceae bacterium]MDR3660483.1 hypothetical protein [Mycobacterium sp.]
MRRTLRSVALAGFVALGGLVGFGAAPARAQGFGGYYPNAYGAYPGGPAYGTGYGNFQAPVITTGAFIGYGGTGPYGYGGVGYGPVSGRFGYGHQHRHHHHYRGCGCRY